MKRESRTVDQSHQVDSPLQRHLPLVDLLVDTRAELMELAVASGLKVLTTMLEADRTAICGPRYAHEPERAASRAGTVTSKVVLGGRKVQIRRPRVRAAAAEVALPTFEAFADTDPLNRRVVEQMLLVVASRRRGPRPRHQQECGESPICREDRRAAHCLAIDRAGYDQSGGAAD